MKILVTGATGFIGKTLVKKLVAEGHRIIILSRRCFLRYELFGEEVEIYEGDIKDFSFLEKLGDFECIIHLSACTKFWGSSKELYDANIVTTENLLKIAEARGVKKFIFASSIEAVGPVALKDAPAEENYPADPISPYGKSKLKAEKAISNFIAQGNGVKVVILRIGNVYGPENPSFIVPIAQSIMRGGMLLEFLPAYRDNYLQFVYIEDAVEGICQALKYEQSATFFLVGDKITIGELFKMIAQELGKKLLKNNGKWEIYAARLYVIIRWIFGRGADLICYFLSGRGERLHRFYSNEKIKRELGFKPAVSLREGIIKTLKWAQREGLL